MAKRFDQAAPGPSQRQQRVGELVRHALAEVLARGDLQDEVLSSHSVTIPEVRMSPDLRLATAYVMPLGGQDEGTVLNALIRNRKILRQEVARRVNLKFAPDLRFLRDASFDEAARIDGAGHVRTFVRVILPLSGPSIATLGILCFTYWWNDLLLPLVMISDTDRQTLPVGLVLLAGRFSTGSLGTIAAGIAMAIVPVLIVFIAAQRYIVQSIASSGLKL